MKKYYVYQHTNNTNGKMYIGITCQNTPKYRWHNGKGYENNKYFTNAIQKYGWDGFTHSVLASGLTQEEAERMEEELINKYDTTNREKGYNILPGGNVNKGGWHHSEEAKRRIGEANRNGAGFSGHKHTQESKVKMSEALKGNTSARKKVKCVETGEVFDSLLLAAQSRGLKGSNSICAAIKNGGRAGGYHWEYYKPTEVELS